MNLHTKIGLVEWIYTSFVLGYTMFHKNNFFTEEVPFKKLFKTEIIK